MQKNILITFLWVLITGNLYSQKINSSKLDSLFQALETNNKFMGNIKISQNGQIIYSKSLGYDDIETNKKSNASTKYRIGSISKMFTACLVFKAIEENKLTLSDTIDKFFPTIKKANKITIGDLLGHRSGIHSFTDNKDYPTWDTQPKSEKEMIDIISKEKIEFEPNSRANYSNSNYVLLTIILEKTYQKTFKEILKEKIIDPVGLQNTYVGSTINISNSECYSYKFSGNWTKEKETDMSIPLGAGAIVSNTGDLIMFLEALFKAKIISAKSLEEMTTIKDNYGMGIFYIPFFEKKGYGHSGSIDGFSSMVVYFPEDKFAVALTSNGTNYANNTIMTDVFSSLYNKPFEIPVFKNIELKTEDLDKYLGFYTSKQIPLKITIIKEGQTLIAQAEGMPSEHLEATEENIFNLGKTGIVLKFKPNEKQMTLKQGPKEFAFSKE